MRETYSKIKLSTANIIPGVGSLDNHFLSLDNAAREGELVARTTLGTARPDSCKAIG